MSPSDQSAIRSGNHWICELAKELDRDPVAEIDALDAWQWEPSEIAIAILSHAMPNGTERATKIVLNVYPWEKTRISKSAYPNKLEDWCRQALIERTIKQTDIVPMPQRRGGKIVRD